MPACAIRNAAHLASVVRALSDAGAAQIARRLWSPSPVLIGVVMTGELVARRTDASDQSSRTTPSIQAYIVNMASEVSGRIVELNVRDNQQVKEGEVLFQIDPNPYQLSVEQARAAVQGLEAQLAVMTNEVASQTSGSRGRRERDQHRRGSARARREPKRFGSAGAIAQKRGCVM